MSHKLGLGSLLLTLALAGCGGSHSSPSLPASRGAASLTVIWPKRTAGRLIPQASNSIRIVLSSNGSSVAQELVARPTDGTNETTTQLTDLPIGTLDVAVTAYPNADGTGVGQAVGTGTLTTDADVPATARVSLASTATALTITPNAPRVGKGTSTTLSVNAVDADGNIVLLSAGGGAETIAWSVDDSSIATVSGAGPTATLSGLRAGTVQVTAALVTNDSGAVVTGSGTSTIVSASGTVIVR